MHKNLLDKKEQDRLCPVEEDHVVGEVPGVAQAAKLVHLSARVKRVHVQQVGPPASSTSFVKQFVLQRTKRAL